MGTSKSKAISSGRSRLNAEDLEKLQVTFKPLIKVKPDIIEETKLEEFFDKLLSNAITFNLCELLAVASKNAHTAGHQIKHRSHKYSGPITFSGLVELVAIFVNGDETELCGLLTKLVSGQKDVVTAKDMQQFLTDIIQSYFNVIKTTSEYKSWENGVSQMDPSKLALNLLHELFFKGKELKNCIHLEVIPEVSFTSNDIEQWHRCTPIATKMISLVFRAAFGLESSDTLDKVDEYHLKLLPICRDVSWQKTSTILTLSDVLFLNQGLPIALNGQWRYLFSTKQYGESFSQLLGKILNKGPTILVIRDKRGSVFGGYASDSWKLQPQFHGDESCFLFTLHPHMGMFPSTGYNNHYMYLNIHQQTMPNGLGMGGQLEYFGLWIDRDFGKGSSSKSCTTFHSPQLSASQEFMLDTVEVWAVGPEPKSAEEGTRSALDHIDPEIKAILEMTNRAPKSDAIREADKKASELENYQK